MPKNAKNAPQASLEPKNTPNPTQEEKTPQEAKSKGKDDDNTISVNLELTPEQKEFAGCLETLVDRVEALKKLELEEEVKPIDWEKAREIIAKDFPDSAIQVNSERTGAEEVGIKPQYIVERLNEAFGENRWRTIEHKADIGQNFVMLKVELQVGYFEKTYDKTNGISGTSFIVEASREAYGGSRMIKGNLPDAMKGAQTDALKKAASMFGVASDAYKGLINIEEGKQREAKARGLVYTPQPKNQAVPVCPKCKAPMNWKNSKRGPFWGCSNYPACTVIVDINDVNSDGSIKNKSSENFMA